MLLNWNPLFSGSIQSVGHFDLRVVFDSTIAGHEVHRARLRVSTLQSFDGT